MASGAGQHKPRRVICRNVAPGDVDSVVVNSVMKVESNWSYRWGQLRVKCTLEAKFMHLRDLRLALRQPLLAPPLASAPCFALSYTLPRPPFTSAYLLTPAVHASNALRRSRTSAVTHCITEKLAYSWHDSIPVHQQMRKFKHSHAFLLENDGIIAGLAPPPPPPPRLHPMRFFTPVERLNFYASIQFFGARPSLLSTSYKADGDSWDLKLGRGLCQKCKAADRFRETVLSGNVNLGNHAYARLHTALQIMTVTRNRAERRLRLCYPLPPPPPAVFFADFTTAA
ncbi:hypothetical protein C8R45DRAFT_936247 [Mycena sanguinolenta]|nr:hypothetical protein C8R45DRAFT_936247 [Mycena sanguinolenta]